MKTNIPIYRAKKLDSDEYVNGYLNSKTYNLASTQHEDLPHYTIETEMAIWRIDKSTLAISFPDMLDKNNKRIFASLSEDGKGGDAVKWLIFPEQEQEQYVEDIVVFKSLSIGTLKRVNLLKTIMIPYRMLEVTGTHKGDSNE